MKSSSGTALNTAISCLNALLSPRQVLLNAPMNEHTTFRIGGPADILLLPENEAQIAGAFQILRECGLPCMAIGRGSNLLVRDKGIRGGVIKLADNFSAIAAEGERLYAQAGAALWALVRKGHEHGLTGMEYAAGIPGTVGGAVVMNAGAYDGEIKNHLVYARVMDGQFNIFEIKNEAMGFGYRTSRAAKEGLTVLGAQFSLQKGDTEAAKAHLKDLNHRRREKQPLEFPSAGSAFKRPPGHFAGALIEAAGLKGFAVGGAAVSPKHAGFIVNTGGASAADVLLLIETVQQRVLAHSGVSLEPEIKIIGEE